MMVARSTEGWPPTTAANAPSVASARTAAIGGGHAREPQQEEGRARHQRHVEAGDGEDVIDAGPTEVSEHGRGKLAALPDEEALEEGARDRRQMGLDHARGSRAGSGATMGPGAARQALHALRPRGQEVARGPRLGDSRAPAPGLRNGSSRRTSPVTRTWSPGRQGRTRPVDRERGACPPPVGPARRQRGGARGAPVSAAPRSRGRRRRTLRGSPGRGGRREAAGTGRAAPRGPTRPGRRARPPPRWRPRARAHAEGDEERAAGTTPTTRTQVGGSIARPSHTPAANATASGRSGALTAEGVRRIPREAPGRRCPRETVRARRRAAAGGLSRRNPAKRPRAGRLDRSVGLHGARRRRAPRRSARPSPS